MEPPGDAAAEEEADLGEHEVFSLKQMHFITLEFHASASLERSFRDSYVRKYRPSVQRAVLIATVIFALFAVNDVMKNEQGERHRFTETIVLRMVACAVGLVAWLLLSKRYTASLERMEMVMAVASLMFGTAQIFFGIWETDTLDPTYSIMLIIISSTSSTFFRQRFLFALTFNALLLVEFVALTASFDAFKSNGDLILTVLGLVCGDVIFLSHSYTREFYIRRGFIQERNLRHEEERCSRLLAKMLPESSIARLRSGAEFVYDKHPAVTILFTHITRFERLAHAIPALELVRLLNALFSRFDEITDRYFIYKVETVGDVYMACSGCPAEYRTPQHASLLCFAAIDM